MIPSSQKEFKILILILVYASLLYFICMLSRADSYEDEHTYIILTKSEKQEKGVKISVLPSDGREKKQEREENKRETTRFSSTKVHRNSPTFPTQAPDPISLYRE
jgi:hypothetical protein